MYAIVDIETTGGFASANDITEIAIVLHDGQQVTEVYETLIKPSVPIPYFIQSLTGIHSAMVAEAPVFEEVADKVFEKLRGRIFVAHNVNFDYSFVKHHLLKAGLELTVPKLCTVRLSRMVFPSLPSYSLGNLCRNFGITIEHRHRCDIVDHLEVRQQPRILHHVADAATQLHGVASQDTLAIDLNGSRARVDHSVDHAKQRRFAAARRSD